MLVNPLRAETYIVKPNDTLSEIVQKKMPNGRIYGLSGNLAKILKLNKNLRSASLIFPGQIIHIQEQSIENTSFEVKDVKGPISETQDAPNHSSMPPTSDSSNISITPGLSLATTSIRATDNNGDSASLVSPRTIIKELFIKTHILSEAFTTGLTVSHTRLNFADAPDERLADKSASLTSFAGLVEFHQKYSDFAFHVGSWERVYIRSSTIGVADFEELNSIGMQAGYTRWLRSDKKYKYGLNLNGQYLLPASNGNLKTKSNPGAGIRLLSGHALFSQHILNLNFGYDWEKQGKRSTNPSLSKYY